MRALLVGAAGQVGCELQRTCPTDVELVALDRASLDIRDGDAIARKLGEIRPEVVLNVAAYTDVDKAESEPDLAFAINAQGPGLLARAVRAAAARLVHVSTDFVFGGERASPRRPEDPVEPLNTYGRSKLAGEAAVVSEAGPHATIVRTAWVYSSHGRNFVKTMLRLMATRDQIAVVSDQVGSPTWARSLAKALWGFARHPEVAGVYHWADAGIASWYDFAVAIQEEALARGLLSREVPIRPIPSSEYPTAARRPVYSVLDIRASSAVLGTWPRHWRKNLRKMLDEIPAA